MTYETHRAYGYGYRMPTQHETSTIARAIAGKHGIKAIETDREWSYDLKKRELRYTRFSPWTGVTYQQWYALLMHEISHILFTDHDVTFPADMQRREWHLLHNYFEDIYIEEQLAQHYPQGVMYQDVLRVHGADIIMNHVFSWRGTVDPKTVPLWQQYLSLLAVNSCGLPGDSELFLDWCSPKVQEVWKETSQFALGKEFASTQETMQWVADHFKPFAKLLEDKQQPDCTIGRGLTLVGDNANNKQDALQDEAGISGRTEDPPEVRYSDDWEAHKPGTDPGRVIATTDPDINVKRYRSPDIGAYKELEQQLRLPSRELRQKIEPILREVRTRRQIARQTSGVIDKRRIWQAAIPKQKVFRKLAEASRIDHYAVTVAIDESGSMAVEMEFDGDGSVNEYKDNGKPWKTALQSAVMIVEACSQMGIPTKVTRFDHDNWNVTKGWNVNHSDIDKGYIASQMRGGNNLDIPALKRFVREAQADMQVTGRKHLVLMIGDGLGEAEMNDTAAELQKKTGVEIYGIVINNHEKGNEDQYPHAKLLDDVSDLPATMQQLLRSYLGRRAI